MQPTVQVRLTQDNLADLLKRLRPQLSAVVSKAALDVETRAKQSILSGDKTGRIYGRHQASAPGEAPANDLGNLAAGIGVTNGSGPLERIVTSNAEYSAGLELGTTEVAARPFMNPALEGVRQPFTRAVQKVVEKG
jgi:hypothetical protein